MKEYFMKAKISTTIDEKRALVRRCVEFAIGGGLFSKGSREFKILSAILEMSK